MIPCLQGPFPILRGAVEKSWPICEFLLISCYTGAEFRFCVSYIVQDNGEVDLEIYLVEHNSAYSSILWQILPVSLAAANSSQMMVIIFRGPTRDLEKSSLKHERNIGGDYNLSHAQ